jgi:hypothetical protein
VVAPHPAMPICPRCHTFTELTATAECTIPPCIGPATPSDSCTRTWDFRQRTITIVANTAVCPYTPTVIDISPCPTATACSDVYCEEVTLGEWSADATRFITNCRPSVTPWTQSTPFGFIPPPITTPPPEDPLSQPGDVPSGETEDDTPHSYGPERPWEEPPVDGGPVEQDPSEKLGMPTASTPSGPTGGAAQSSA